jgi:S1-C subfamily serine protease
MEVVMKRAVPIAFALMFALHAPATKAQSAPPRKDIRSIAKAANGSIVSIIMSDDNGKPIAQGTGFVVTKDGLIVTNYHVIAEGRSAVAKLPDGAIYVLQGVVASDKTRDVAVVKANGQNFQTLVLGNSDRVEVGEEVIAIGNPLSLESTVSNGIVSGIRTAEELGGKFLQVTAPISPGSSGGPLFNMAGEVIGITTLYLKGGENLNFAIPINDAKRLLLDLSAKRSGKAAPVWPNEPESAKTQEHESDGSGGTPDSKPTNANPGSARAYYEEIRKAGGFVNRMKAQEDGEWGKKGKTYRVLNGGIYACIPDDTREMLRINFLTFQAYRLSNVKSAPASPYVQDTTGTDMINNTLQMLETVKVHLPIILDSFEQLNVAIYVTGTESLHDFYFRQGWLDSDEWRYGSGDTGAGKLSINSATMRFAGSIPLLGGIYVTGKCEKIFRRTVYEVESSSSLVGKCTNSVCFFGSAAFDQELREQGIEVRP